LFADISVAQAAEIDWSKRFWLNPEDIGLTEEYFDQLEEYLDQLDIDIPINYTDVPEHVIIRGSRLI
jgi:hypothetical protein